MPEDFFHHFPLVYHRDLPHGLLALGADQRVGVSDLQDEVAPPLRGQFRGRRGAEGALALAASGSLPENVNYAVKSSYLLSFLESVPEVFAKLEEPETKERKFEDVVKSAEQAAVLVLVY